MRATITATYGTPPQIGQTYAHPRTGKPCRIVRVLDFGTMHIETETGNRFQVTGLPWGLIRKAGAR